MFSYGKLERIGGEKWMVYSKECFSLILSFFHVQVWKCKNVDFCTKVILNGLTRIYHGLKHSYVFQETWVLSSPTTCFSDICSNNLGFLHNFHNWNLILKFPKEEIILVIGQGMLINRKADSNQAMCIYIRYINNNNKKS